MFTHCSALSLSFVRSTVALCASVRAPPCTAHLVWDLQRQCRQTHPISRHLHYIMYCVNSRCLPPTVNVLYNALICFPWKTHPTF